MRRRHNGTFRHIEPRHLHRYINESAGRLSIKEPGAADKMLAIVQNIVGKRLAYRQLVAPSTLCGRP